MKVAIPRFGESVAPCLEYSATITIFTLEGGRVVGEMDFGLESQNPMDRVRLLRDQGVDTLICGGLQNRFEDLVVANGIRVISWVSGSVSELIQQFVQGRLTSGTTSDGAGQTRERKAT